MAKEKSSRGNASQFFIAGELCRRGYSAVVTLGNTPNTDILCSNMEGTKFVHIQVKTYVPSNTASGKGATCSVGMKAEKEFGSNFFWILGGIPKPDQEAEYEYYIIPSKKMAENIRRIHKEWLETPGKKGQPHKDTTMRVVDIPPKTSSNEWDISKYKNKWDLIEKKLKA